MYWFSIITIRPILLHVIWIRTSIATYRTFKTKNPTCNFPWKKTGLIITKTGNKNAILELKKNEFNIPAFSTQYAENFDYENYPKKWEMFSLT